MNTTIIFKHNYKGITKEEALNSLEVSYSNCLVDDVFVKDKEGHFYKVTIEFDGDAENPRDWDNICSITSRVGGWDIADKGLAFSEIEKIEEQIQKPNIYSKIVYMYEHSGQTISLAPFGDPWDSGPCGYIFVSKEKIKENYPDATDENWKEIADNVMKSEIEIYDQYIRGETYYLCLYQREMVHHRSETGREWDTEEFTLKDCVGGFYGSDWKENGLFETIFNCLPTPNEYTFYKKIKN